LAVDLLKIQKLIETFTIPFNPKIIRELRVEMSSSSPDLSKVGALAATDINLSSGILQTVNSPSLKEEGKPDFVSIKDAVEFLGLEKLTKVISALEKRESKMVHSMFDRFFDAAVDVAVIAEKISQMRQYNLDAEAFLLGLFRDCGVPILMQVYDGYRQIMIEADAHVEDHRKIIALEEDRIDGINHQLVGYMASNNWRLPELISRSILTSHDIEPPMPLGCLDVDSTTHKKNVLNAIIRVAEIVSMRFRTPFRRVPTVVLTSCPWPNFHDHILNHLDITQYDLHQVMDDIYEELDELIAKYYY